MDTPPEHSEFRASRSCSPELGKARWVVVSFACALQDIRFHRFRLYLHSFRGYSFPEKRNGWNTNGLTYVIQDNGEARPARTIKISAEGGTTPLNSEL